jgi:precorrin-6B methylase 2
MKSKLISVDSLSLLKEIGKKIHTPHYNQHLLLDIAMTYPSDYEVVYVEIGCLNSTSACLMLQRPNTMVVSIDLGVPVSEKTVQENARLFNKFKNKFYYIQGNSQIPETREKLKKITSKIDILFIDGSHQYQAVVDDFYNYCVMILKGGFIVFDDYNNDTVRKAIHDIIEKEEENDKYEIIGNIITDYNTGNDFILRKRSNLLDEV